MTATRRWDAAISMWVITCKGCPTQVTSKSALRLWCDECVAENNRKQRRAYYHANREQELAAARQRKYGMSDDDVRAALATQGGKCPVCLLSVPEDDISVDHDHETGGFRGILHSSCNTALGMFQDDADRCARAAAYLRRPALPLAVAAGPGMRAVEPTTCTACSRHGTRGYIPNGDGTYRCRDGHRCSRKAARKAAGVGVRGRTPKTETA